MLEPLGVDTSSPRAIDAVEAALCAICASYLIKGARDTFGSRKRGCIIASADVIAWTLRQGHAQNAMRLLILKGGVSGTPHALRLRSIHETTCPHGVHGMPIASRAPCHQLAGKHGRNVCVQQESRRFLFYEGSFQAYHRPFCDTQISTRKLFLPIRSGSPGANRGWHARYLFTGWWCGKAGFGPDS